MSALVFVELDGGKAKKSSLEAVSYAKELAGEVTALVFGSDADADAIGAAGASSVLLADDEQLRLPNIMAYASAVAEAMTTGGHDILILAKSSLGDPVAARVAIKTGASLAANVSELGTMDAVKTSIYTGKAFANAKLTGAKKIISLKKNAIEIKTDGTAANVVSFAPAVSDDDFKVKVTKTEKATGDVLLPEADVVVSAGRGLKGPENWEMIEDLAKTLGAATACSKPVSDMDWRPHHEHMSDRQESRLVHRYTLRWPFQEPSNTWQE